MFAKNQDGRIIERSYNEGGSSGSAKDDDIIMNVIMDGTADNKYATILKNEVITKLTRRGGTMMLLR